MDAEEALLTSSPANRSAVLAGCSFNITPVITAASSQDFPVCLCKTAARPLNITSSQLPP